MPFVSENQRKYLWAKRPKIAKRWSKEYPNQGKLPKKIRRRAGELYKTRNK